MGICVLLPQHRILLAGIHIRLNPFYFCYLEKKTDCLNLVFSKGIPWDPKTLRILFIWKMISESNTESEKKVGGNPIKNKVIELVTTVGKWVQSHWGTSEELCRPCSGFSIQRRVWGIHLSPYWLRVAIQRLMPPLSPSTLVLSDCLVFLVGDLPYFTKSAEKWRRWTGTWNAMLSICKQTIDKSLSPVRVEPRNRFHGIKRNGCGKSASP